MSDGSNNRSGLTAAEGVSEAIKGLSDRFASIPAGPLAVLTSKLSIASGLAVALDSEADGYNRVEGAVKAARGAVGSTVGALATVSGGIGEVGAAAAALAPVAGFLAIGSLVLAQFGNLGRPYYEAAQQSAAAGGKAGHALGFAAGATGADEAFVRNDLDIYRHMPGGDGATEAYKNAYREGLWTGYREASNLAAGDKFEYQKNIVEFAVDHGLRFDGWSDEYTSLVFGFARAATVAAESGDSLLPDDGDSSMSAPDDGDSSMSAPDDGDSSMSAPDDGDSSMSLPDDGDSSMSAPDDGDSSMSAPDDGDSSMSAPDDGDSSMSLPDDGDSSMSAPDDGDSSMSLPDDGDSSMSLPDDGDSSMSLPDDGETSMSAPNNSDTSMSLPDDGDSSMSLPDDGETSMSAPNNSDTSEAQEFEAAEDLAQQSFE